MVKALSIFVVVALLAVMPGIATAQGQSDSAAAAEMISHAQRVVGQVVKAARGVPELNAERAEAKPFWEAMKELNESLDKAQTGLSLKDQTFFTNLATAHAELIRADVALGMSGAQNKALSSAMKNLSGLVSALDENYSKESARLKQGGALTRDERRQLDKLQKQQKEIMAKLDQVERNAAKNNKEMQEGIKKIRKESEKIRKARKTPAGFVSGFMAARMMSNWMWGWHWWWGPWGAWCPGWININIIIWDDWLDVVPYDWALVDVAVELDTLDLDLALLEISDADLAIADEFLIDGDFSLDDGDLVEITSDLDLGWDDVDTEIGLEIMDRMESNFDDGLFDPGFEMDHFDDYGMDDFGADFGAMDFGLDW